MFIKNRTAILVITSLIIGGAVGFALSNLNASKNIGSTEFRAGGHKFINPLYECVNQEYFGDKDFGDLEEKLVDHINESVEDNEIDRISIYFRDLNNGPWFGINEKANFSPASLLKVPIMMAYFKEADSNSSVLQKKILFEEKKSMLVPITNPREAIELGKEYSIEELIEKMIVNSDNNASALLVRDLGIESVNKVTRDLGIPTPNTLEDYMSVKDYASFFRVLYNDSYLDTQYSEKALELLTKTDFVEGIRQPVPKEIPVAQKFGERHFQGTTSYQLHDCGIIYYPNRPYLLCIMSQGENYDLLLKVIRDISSQVYEEYDARYR